MLLKVLLFVGLFAQALSKPATDCSLNTADHVVSDDVQCDRFHVCKGGKLFKEYLCNNGLVYDPVGSNCVLPFKVNCGNRQQLQEPKQVGNCPRPNGRWGLVDSCDEYLDCTNGIERKVRCQNHLVYDDATGDCEHPDVANRVGCTAEERYGFSCPAGVTEARYGAEYDCRAFFLCGVQTKFHPRLGGCPQGTVFNEATGVCDSPENVPRCKDYYSS